MADFTLAIWMLKAAQVFTWAFDCGSRSRSKFDEYLKAWTRRERVDLDWLFISHFDADHVSGLNVLMSRTIVRNVMVPYLNERELAYVLLQEVARGNVDRNLVELTADPTGFFVSRGADRVVFLSGGASEEPGIGEGPRPGGSKEDFGPRTIIDPQPTPLTTAHMADSGSQDQEVAQLIRGGVCTIDMHAGIAGVRLKPYRAPVQPHVLPGILKEIQKLLGPTPTSHLQPGLGPLAFAVARYARTPAGRAGLKAIYKQYVGSSNRASLSLLSVPLVSSGATQHWQMTHPFPWPRGADLAPAWLNTGDAELLKSADLKSWENAYGGDLDQVRALALPHHGSDKNSGPAFHAKCSEAVLIAHARVGSAKHPGDEVSAAAGDR